MSRRSGLGYVLSPDGGHRRLSGLTLETVSRTLTQLQSEAIVEFPSQRRFTIKRWDVLEDLAA